MRLAFFGMESAFSVAALRSLVEAGHDVVLAVRPTGGLAGRQRRLLRRDRGLRRRVENVVLGPYRPPDPERRDPFALAGAHGIPCYWVGDASTPEVGDLLQRERVEAVAIAFFNQLLRDELLERVPAGVVNAHPSLLPRFRGPAPLFWTFREGDEETGVTVHRVTRGEDAGPVLGRGRLEVPLGIGGEDLVEELGVTVARLLPRAVDGLAAGAPGKPQAEEGLLRARRPGDAELRIDPRWSAERIYRFVRGVGRWNTLIFEAEGRPLRAWDAVAFDVERDVPGEFALVGDHLLLGCRPGVVTLRVLPL